MKLTESDERRFWSKVALPDREGCMLWTASTTTKGYGRIRIGAHHAAAHRVSYVLAYGEIPAGLQLDHLCRVRHCVAPLHLEAVTNRENVRRGLAGAVKRAQTHCKRGHEFTPENTRLRPNGTRLCRTCALLAVHAHRARARKALL
ncbi:HNH endonuclease signature motif containing protein [Streptomyces sp. NPDC087420]|uniref:HNH endonuclease signature motif containing protein n=1 Tax=Streptomyces sp. NPDC087420 TaxID=3365785 RepID=UPI003838C650